MSPFSPVVHLVRGALATQAVGCMCSPAALVLGFRIGVAGRSIPLLLSLPRNQVADFWGFPHLAHVPAASMSIRFGVHVAPHRFLQSLGGREEVLFLFCAIAAQSWLHFTNLHAAFVRGSALQCW